MKHLQLIRLLVGRELTLRYKRSVIGIGWTLLNPMLTSFVLWVVFSFVFAGCGIVDGSDPDIELAETYAKFAPMRSALT